MVITMAKLRMAHASTHGARKPPGPKTDADANISDPGLKNCPTFTFTAKNEHQKTNLNQKLKENYSKGRKRSYRKFNLENNHKIMKFFNLAQTNTGTGDSNGGWGGTEGVGVEH